jgi:hypothetical protein
MQPRTPHVFPLIISLFTVLAAGTGHAQSAAPASVQPAQPNPSASTTPAQSAAAANPSGATAVTSAPAGFAGSAGPNAVETPQASDETKVHPGFYFGLAAGSMWAAGSGGTWAPGVDVILQGQNGHWAFGGMIRGYLSPELQAGLSSIVVNAKFFVLDANYSPYIGAGLGGYAIATRVQPDQNLTDGYGNFGFGSLFEVGFEAFRYSAVRLGVFGRVDVPFFKLEQVDITTDSRDYVAPVSAGLYFLF